MSRAVFATSDSHNGGETLRSRSTMCTCTAWPRGGGGHFRAFSSSTAVTHRPAVDGRKGEGADTKQYGMEAFVVWVNEVTARQSSAGYTA